MPWRKKGQPTPVFLPEKPHGQRSLVGYSPWDLSQIWHTHAAMKDELSSVQCGGLGGTSIVVNSLVFSTSSELLQSRLTECLLPVALVCCLCWCLLSFGQSWICFLHSRPCPSLALACVIGADSHKMQSRLLPGFDQCQARLEYREEAEALGREKHLDIHIKFAFPIPCKFIISWRMKSGLFIHLGLDI